VLPLLLLPSPAPLGPPRLGASRWEQRRGAPSCCCSPRRRLDAWGRRWGRSSDELGKPELSKTQVLGKACDNISIFYGLFKLLDMEIRLAVEPFMLWEDGDFRPFLRALPSMCVLIASGHKPKVSVSSHVLLTSELPCLTPRSRVPLSGVEGGAHCVGARHGAVPGEAHRGQRDSL